MLLWLWLAAFLSPGPQHDHTPFKRVVDEVIGKLITQFVYLLLTAIAHSCEKGLQECIRCPKMTCHVMEVWLARREVEQM